MNEGIIDLMEEGEQTLPEDPDIHEIDIDDDGINDGEREKIKKEINKIMEGM